MVNLSSDFFKSLRPSKHFPPPADPEQSLSTSSSTSTSVNPKIETASLDFDATGEFLVTASSSTNHIQLFGCENGDSKKVLFSKKYGVGQIKFAHKSTTVIYTSTKGEDGKEL